VTDGRVQRDNFGPVRAGALGAAAAGLGVGLELGLLAYWADYFGVSGKPIADAALGLAGAAAFGLWLYFKGIPLPRRWR
jgi:hypothetical protein